MKIKLWHLILFGIISLGIIYSIDGIEGMVHYILGTGLGCGLTAYLVKKYER